MPTYEQHATSMKIFPISDVGYVVLASSVDRGSGASGLRHWGRFAEAAEAARAEARKDCKAKAKAAAGAGTVGTIISFMYGNDTFAKNATLCHCA